MARPRSQQAHDAAIAAATDVLLESGFDGVTLDEVAARSGVAKTTLYRHFGSKEGLLDAFGLYEQDNFDSGIAAAMVGLSGADRLDAALRFVVEFQSTYSLGSLADIEPEHVIHQMKRALPIMHERIARVIPADDGGIAPWDQFRQRADLT